MKQTCKHCQENTFFIINDDNFEVCNLCGFVQDVHYENIRVESESIVPYSQVENKIETCVSRLFPVHENEKERLNIVKKVQDMCQVFHKKSTIQKSISLFYKLKRLKPKQKKVSDDKILKFAFYITSNQEACPLTLPNFLCQNQLTLKQFKRISKIFHKYFTPENPKQHLSALCCILNVTGKEESLITKVMNDTQEYFEEHTLFTFLIVLMYTFSLCVRHHEDSKLQLKQLCTLFEKKSKSNILKVLKTKGHIIQKSFKIHMSKLRRESHA